MDYVAYYRVSTKRQGRSGLGLEAQRNAVEGFLGAEGGNLLQSFTEVESGRKGDRPELERALETCRLCGARLVIAKLDRLARNAAFLMNLQEAGVEFVCCDMPEANWVTVGFMAIMAQHEAQRISERTKAALAVAKARGVKLGTAGPRNLKNRTQGGDRGRETQSKNSQDFAKRLASRVLPRLDEGQSLRQIAQSLEEEQIRTLRGGRKWHPEQVRQIARRLGRS